MHYVMFIDNYVVLERLRLKTEVKRTSPLVVCCDFFLLFGDWSDVDDAQTLPGSARRVCRASSFCFGAAK